MKGLLLTNAFATNEHIEFQSNSFIKEFNLLGVDLIHKTNSELLVYINNDGDIAKRFSEYDFILYFDKDKYIGKMLEKVGCLLINSSSSVEACDDKMLTHILLANNGIKMPRTISYPLCYEYHNNIEPVIASVLKAFNFPFIIKENFGSLGKQVYLVNNKEELMLLENKLRYVPHLYQEFISESIGVDYRLILIGNKVVSAMKRSNDSNFVANIGSGGKGETYIPDTRMKEIAIKASKILGLDYCGIDFVINSLGEPVLLEVNSNAFFKEIDKINNINIPEIFAKYVIEKVKNID